MKEYETEEQQVEALKKWWKEQGTSLLTGLLIGVLGLFGWRYYGEQSYTHSVQASDMYMQVMQNVALMKVDDKTFDINNQLINDFSDTPYASLSSLSLAKYEYERGESDNAAAQLELVIKHASDDLIRQVASLRLSRVYIEQEKYTEALALLSGVHNAAFDAQYEEVKGDLHKAKGEMPQARTAYDKAIELQGNTVSKWLRLKRQNLGA